MKQLSFSNQSVELLLPLKRKNSRIATTDLEYKALFNDYGEYADNFTVNIFSSESGEGNNQYQAYFSAGVLLAKIRPGVEASSLLATYTHRSSAIPSNKAVKINKFVLN